MVGGGIIACVYGTGLHDTAAVARYNKENSAFCERCGLNRAKWERENQSSCTIRKTVRMVRMRTLPKSPAQGTHL